jgi:phosphoenolpyruvate carboxylase
VLELVSPETAAELEKTVALTGFTVNGEHRELTSRIIDCLRNGETSLLPELILSAARVRRFLG